MIVHHTQGTLMSYYAEQHTTDDEIAVMAYDIDATQTAQIGQMQGWLALWQLPQVTGEPAMGWMATVSDIVVYGDDKTPRTEVEALAKKISRAQALWQKKNGSQQDNEERSFNTFVVSGKWQTFKRSSRASNHA
jgi:hypothetical protein